MTNADDADLRAWFHELVASDPVRRLREFREHHPDEPIPRDLEFTALYEPILIAAGSPFGDDARIAAQIDELLEAEPRPGAPEKPWRAEAFLRIDYLIQRCGLSIRRAVERVTGELNQDDTDWSRESLLRAYQRFCVHRLRDQFARAVLDGDEAAGVAILQELTRRQVPGGSQRKVIKK